VKLLLEDLYAAIPTVECKRLCVESCGPIYVGKNERSAITRFRGGVPPAQLRPDARCSLLKDDGTCSVYPARPFICRFFGAVETLPCPWDCKVTPRKLTGEEARDLYLKFKEAIGESVGLAEEDTAVLDGFAKSVLDLQRVRTT
jgi:Fe-S-cluster containining protein